MASTTKSTGLTDDKCKLTEVAKKHALVKTVELSMGKEQPVKCFEPMPLAPKTILTLNNILDRQVSGKFQDKIFDTYEKALAPVCEDIKQPILASLLGPSAVDPLFLLELAKIPKPPNLPSIPEIGAVLLKMVPFGGQNVVANVFLPPPPLMPPPTDGTPSEIAICVVARQGNFSAQLGISLEEIFDNIGPLTFALNEIKFAKPSIPELPEILINPILYPVQFKEQFDISLASLTGNINLMADISPISFVTDLANPAELAGKLMEKACKSMSSTNKSNPKTHPTKAAIEQGAAQTSSAQMTSSIVSKVLGTGAAGVYIFEQNTAGEIKAIDDRVAAMKHAYTIQSRVALEDAKQAAKRKGPLGTYRAEFVKLVNMLLGEKQTKYTFKGAKQPENCLSVGCDLMNLSGKKNLFGFNDIKSPAGSTLADKVPYTAFMTPHHFKKYSSSETKLKGWLTTTSINWSSCAMTVRAVVIALSTKFPGTGNGTFYTQEYDPAKANAMAHFAPHGPSRDAKYKFNSSNEKEVKAALENIKPGDFFLIQAFGGNKTAKQKNSGTEHVAMWLSETPPELGKASEPGAIVEGGQADRSTHVFRSDALKNAAAQGQATLINGNRLGTNQWTFFMKHNRLMCRFKNALTQKPASDPKVVIGIYNMEIFKNIIISRKP